MDDDRPGGIEYVCPTCGGALEDSAGDCRHCGLELPDGPVAMYTPGAGQARRLVARVGLAILALLAVGAAVAWIVGGVPGS